jgi:integrase
MHSEQATAMGRLSSLVQGGTPLPPGLDGRHGTNRAPRGNQLDAEDDLAAVRAFLAEYDSSPATQRAYTKEAERLLLWAVFGRQKALSSLTRDDFNAYAAFLADPQPRDVWCGPRLGRRGARLSAGWRPFAGPLSPSARKTALVIINSLMSYLVQARYLAANPLALMRQRHRVGEALQSSRRQVVERCFDAVQWSALRGVLDAEEGLPGDRNRFLVAVLYFLALRISELATHSMGDFFEARGRWFFSVLGKGGKAAEIPVHPELLTALRRYRAGLGWEPLPCPGDPTPLVVAADGARLGVRRIHQIIKALTDRAAATMAASEPERAAHMRQASPHWFRHTSLTRQADSGMELRHIKANARHAKLDTTMLYVHTDSDARHDEITKLTW